MQAVQINPCTLLSARSEIRRHFDLNVAAHSADNATNFIETRLLNRGRGSFNKELRFLRTIRDDAAGKLLLHDGFTRGLLRGMSHHAGPDCQLQMLADAGETSFALKTLIGEFAGVPIGKELRMIRQASVNLSTLPRSFRRTPSDLSSIFGFSGDEFDP